MEDKQSESSYKGQDPLVAAAQTFVSSTVLVFTGATALILTAGHFLCKAGAIKKFETMTLSSAIGQKLKDPIGWTIAGLFGAYDAMKSYRSAREAQSQHEHLLTDNIEMRSQLNQTGQILRHVAGRLERGEMADSQLTVDSSAPPSHVAKLEAEKAAQELAQVSPAIH
jgi:hypothetical protein